MTWTGGIIWSTREFRWKFHCEPLINFRSSFVDRDLFMRFVGNGVGHQRLKTENHHLKPRTESATAALAQIPEAAMAGSSEAISVPGHARLDGLDTSLHSTDRTILANDEQVESEDERTDSDSDFEPDDLSRPFPESAFDDRSP